MAIFELVLVSCLSANSCIVVREQMPEEECEAKMEQQIEKYGYDPDHPPYLEQEPTCTKLGEYDNMEWR